MLQVQRNRRHSCQLIKETRKQLETRTELSAITGYAKALVRSRK
jgi:hypothetical protein